MQMPHYQLLARVNKGQFQHPGCWFVRKVSGYARSNGTAAVNSAVKLRCAPSSCYAQEVLRDAATTLGFDGFGVELDAVERAMRVPHGHEYGHGLAIIATVVRPGGREDGVRQRT
jgi:hypothetical protein